jgi:hypothetical protein
MSPQETSTVAPGYFSRAEIEGIDVIDVMEHHRERIEDAFAAQTAAFVR